MSETPSEDELPPIKNMADLLKTSYQFLGYSAAAQRVGIDSASLYGKWCQRCNGIWFGLALEVECPRCGNRKG
jgi:hypothetical protein